MLGIILINYRNSKEVATYIFDELSKITIEKKIIIIDNSCDVKTYDELLNLTGAIDLTNNAITDKNDSIFAVNTMTNLGYAKGNNLGFEILMNSFECEFVLFSNSDIRITDNDTVSYLISILKSDSNIALIGPKVIYPDGIDQSPNNYIPFFRKYIAAYLLRPFFRKKMENGYNSDVVYNAPAGYYYRLIGCFIIAKSIDFKAAGMFDEETFLYAEEKILSERLKVINKTCYYDPAKTIIHYESKTIAKKLTLIKKWFQIYKSDKYYYTKYRKLSSIYVATGKLSLMVFFYIYQPIFNKIKSLQVAIK